MRRSLFLLVSMKIVCTVIGQDIVYPKDEEPAHLSGNNPVITERIPIYIPKRCPENMLLYPGSGDESTWICDCKPGFLYFPSSKTCHEAYSQGPCSSENYVYLAEGEAVPRCIRNPCSRNDLVPYGGRCYTLGSEDESPCGHRSKLRVNYTTYQLECVVLRPKSQ